MSCIYKKKEKILMFKFIEEFYYGNIDPQARSTKENKAASQAFGLRGAGAESPMMRISVSCMSYRFCFIYFFR